MRQHITILATIRLIYHGMGLLVALTVLTLAVGGGALAASVGGAEGREALPFILIVGLGIAGFMGLLALPGVAAGIGLLKLRPWGRILAIILGVLDLFNFPVGTALGVYTLWVLFHEETLRIFDQASATEGDWTVG